MKIKLVARIRASTMINSVAALEARANCTSKVVGKYCNDFVSIFGNRVRGRGKKRCGAAAAVAVLEAMHLPVEIVQLSLADATRKEAC